MIFQKAEITEAEVASLIAEYSRDSYRITRQPIIVSFGEIEESAGEELVLERQNEPGVWETIHKWYIEE